MVSPLALFGIVSGLATIIAAVIALLRVGRTWGSRQERAKNRGERLADNEDDIQRIEARIDRVEDGVSEVHDVVSDLHDIALDGEADDSGDGPDIERETGSYSPSAADKWRDETGDGE